MVVSQLLRILIHPKDFFVEIRDNPWRFWKTGPMVYIASVAASALFHTLRPNDFPFDKSFVPTEIHGPIFWGGIFLAGSGLLLLSTGFLNILLRLLRGKASFFSLLVLWMCLHVYLVLSFIPLSLAAVWQSEELYQITQVGFSFLTTILGVLGVREISSVSIPKAFFALLLSTLLMAGVLFWIYFQGWLSSDAMKVLIFL